MKDERGQEQPTDKKRAQQTSQNTAKEGGGAYAPHEEGERVQPNLDPATKKSEILMSIPSDNKNQVNRSRKEPDPAAFSAKPELDEIPQGGLRGQDKRQAALEDASPRGESHDETLDEQRTEHQDAQHGADVRAPFIKAVDTLPEGLQRERTHPLSPTEGRGDDPSHIPAAKN